MMQKNSDLSWKLQHLYIFILYLYLFLYGPQIASEFISIFLYTVSIKITGKYIGSINIFYIVYLIILLMLNHIKNIEKD